MDEQYGEEQLYPYMENLSSKIWCYLAYKMNHLSTAQEQFVDQIISNYKSEKLSLQYSIIEKVIVYQSERKNHNTS